jgi:putative transcriptional regulator
MQEKLLLLRKRHNYSQAYVAKQLNMSPTQYGQKERGLYEFKSDEMFKASKLFDKRIDEIFMPRGHRNGDNKKE